MQSYKKFEIVPFISAFFIFMLLNPFYFWGLNFSHLYRIVLTLSVCYIFYCNRDRNLNIGKHVLYIIATFCYVFFGALQGRASVIGTISASLCFFYIFIFTAKDSFRLKVLDYFISIFAIMCGIGAIFWMLYLYGIKFPLGMIYCPTQPDRSYFVYPFFIVEDYSFGDADVFRYYGPFNEPGVVGTIATLLLVCKNFEIKNWRVLTIFISGLLSLSLFFYIVVVIYLCFYSIFIKRNILYMILLIGGVFLFYNNTKDNYLIYNTIWGRLEWDSTEKSISGDNRSNEQVDKYYDTIKGTTEYYWGTTDSNWYQTVANGESSSYKNVICIHGAICVFFYIFYLLHIGYVNRRSLFAFILYSAVVIANFYQRSSIFSLPILFLYYNMPQCISDYKSSQLLVNKRRL